MSARATAGRRLILKRVLAVAAVAGLAVAVAGCAGPRHSQAGGKPNIVFVLTDDLSWNLIRHMPQVQAMQTAGTTLSRYYVVDSLCCPSRSAIFTGEYPHNDGVFTNLGSEGGYAAYNSHGDQQKTFALSLQKAGYRTGFMGKYLNGYQPSDPIPPGWNEWDVAGKGYPEFNYALNEDGTQRYYGRATKDYMVDVLSGKAGSFIDSSAKSGEPFMLEVATFAPHAPYTPAPRYAGTAKHVPYPKTGAYDTLPTNPPSWLKGRPPLTIQQQQMLKNDYDKRVEADKAVDDLIGHIRSVLARDGLAGNTYLVFSSDNGYHMGEYRLLAGKQTGFETDVRVPTVIDGPGVPAGHDVPQLTTNIDLAPTFESLAGAKIGSGVDGVSMARLWHGQQPSNWQHAVLIEHHGPNNQPGDPDGQNAHHADPPSYQAVRTATALYVRYASGEQEYYNTATDPAELHNLGGAAAPAHIKRQLAALRSCHGSTACQAAAR